MQLILRYMFFRLSLKKYSLFPTADITQCQVLAPKYFNKFLPFGTPVNGIGGFGLKLT